MNMLKVKCEQLKMHQQSKIKISNNTFNDENKSFSRTSMGQDISKAENKDEMMNYQEESFIIIEGLRQVQENARRLTASIEEMKKKIGTNPGN